MLRRWRSPEPLASSRAYRCVLWAQLNPQVHGTSQQVAEAPSAPSPSPM